MYLIWSEIIWHNYSFLFYYFMCRIWILIKMIFPHHIYLFNGKGISFTCFCPILQIYMYISCSTWSIKQLKKPTLGTRHSWHERRQYHYRKSEHFHYKPTYAIGLLPIFHSLLFALTFPFPLFLSLSSFSFHLVQSQSLFNHILETNIHLKHNTKTHTLMIET